MEAFLVSTGVVALGEMGDKTQLLAMLLAARFRKPIPIVLGILVATLANHAMAGALGGLLGRGLGTVAGSLESKASVVTLSLFDIRSTVQIASAEGNATATNFGAALGAFGGGAAGSLGGFSRTPEGKATVAAFIDAYNSMVISLRNYKAQEVRGGLGRGGVLKVGQ